MDQMALDGIVHIIGRHHIALPEALADFAV
jgi:hypothetical protein